MHLAPQAAGATSHVDGSVMGFEFEYTQGGTERTHVVLFAQPCFKSEMPSAWNMLGVPGNDKFPT